MENLIKIPISRVGKLQPSNFQTVSICYVLLLGLPYQTTVLHAYSFLPNLQPSPEADKSAVHI